MAVYCCLCQLKVANNLCETQGYQFPPLLSDDRRSTAMMEKVVFKSWRGGEEEERWREPR